MKSLMDKPHMITTDDRLTDDSIFEPIRLEIHRARHTRHPLLLLFLCTFLAIIWFLFRR